MCLDILPGASQERRIQEAGCWVGAPTHRANNKGSVRTPLVGATIQTLSGSRKGSFSPKMLNSNPVRPARSMAAPGRWPTAHRKLGLQGLVPRWQHGGSRGLPIGHFHYPASNYPDTRSQQICLVTIFLICDVRTTEPPFTEKK